MNAIEPSADDDFYNSIFERPWWLDAVAPGAWGSVTVRRDGAIAGRLPYVLGRRLGRAVIVQPPLTQTLGPWLHAIEAKPAKRVSAEVNLVGELIDGLPAVSLMTQHLSPTLTNWLPFHWRGYSATSFITYRLDDVSDLDAIWSGLKSTVRRGARAAKRFTVSTDCDVGALIALNQRTFRRQGLAQPYDDDLRLPARCRARRARCAAPLRRRQRRWAPPGDQLRRVGRRLCALPDGGADRRGARKRRGEPADVGGDPVRVRGRRRA